MRALGLERGTREIWNGRGITGRKSQDNRNEIGPTVKNVGFLKINRGRTAEESRARWQIIVRIIELWISELLNAVLLVAVIIGVESEENDARTNDRR